MPRVPPRAVAGALLFLTLLLIPAATAGCRDETHPRTPRHRPLRIAAATSLRAAIDDLARAWEAASGEHLATTFAASGPLAQQVAAGAPIDVFISAGMPQLDMLEAGAIVDPASIRIVATNTLVLVAPAHANATPNGMDALANPAVRRIAIGHPRTVPAGLYAQQTLERLGLADRLSDRLVYGTDVRQVLSYVEHGDVDLGLVYRTDAVASAGVTVVATCAPNLHDPIQYPAAIVAASPNRAAAEAFIAFLGTAEAAAIFETHGFGPAGD